VPRFTTERVSPESAALRVTWLQCLAPYRWAVGLARGLAVLDLGCGEGYGTAELAGVARLAVGLDRDASTLRRARARSPGPRLAWVAGQAEALPFADGAFDLVCCFQVLEHLADPARFLGEARRVLAPGGRLLLTTPNRPAVLAGLNPHHAREYDAASLRALLAPVFPRVELLGVYGSARVLAYRARNRALVTRLVGLDRLGLRRRLPRPLVERLHAWGTLLVRSWIERRDPALARAIGPGDFAVAAGDLEAAIDLVAVCTLEE
jgi:SAM-dependent methyltransferase